MKSLGLITPTVALAAALSVAPATAQNLAPCGSARSVVGASATPSSANNASTAPHWEYQYGYDKHAAWRGHWVLVR
ncbi:MAG: hypothetical protein JO081_18600 [Alphaproteobacteria bacterium]|nr:hypothetical protein [Alphaproteobacteria bacterium]